MMMMMVSTKASRSQAAMLAAATTVNALFSEDSLQLTYNEILPPSLLKTILLIERNGNLQKHCYRSCLIKVFTVCKQHKYSYTIMK